MRLTCFQAPQSKKRAVWENNLRKVATIETLEDFWAVMNKVAPASKLPASCNYHLFREGIEPKWEDKANEGGGKV
jgi:translation initiation factor 4E